MPLFEKIRIGNYIGSSTSGSILFADSNISLAQDNSNIFWDDTNNRLGIGTATPAADIEIMISGTGDIGFIVQAVVGQTADLAQFLNSSGSKRSSFNSQGLLRFWDGQTETLSSSFVAVNLGGTLTLDNVASVLNGYTLTSTITYSAVPVFGVMPLFFYFAPTFNLSATSTLWTNAGTFFSQATYVSTNGIASKALGTFPAFRDNPSFNVSGTGTWDNTSAYTSYSSLFAVGTGTTWGTRTAFVIAEATGAGTLVTQVGLDIASLVKGGTTNIAIRTVGTTQSQFGGRLKVGANSTPGAMLDIINIASTDISLILQGAASQSADHLQILDSGGDNYISISTVTGANGYVKIGVTGKTYGAGTSLAYFVKNSTTTLGSGSSLGGFSFQGEFNWTANSPFGIPGTFFQFISNMRFSGSTNQLSGFGVYAHQGTYIADATTMAATGLFGSFFDNPTYSLANAGTWGTTGAYVGFHSNFISNTSVTWGTRRGFVFEDGTGAGNIATQVGLDIATLTKGGTANIAIRTGAGGVIEFGNKITKYNNIATVSGGVPSELATVDLTTQAAAVAATTIYTPAATGAFRVSGYLQVTRAATTSSTLGGVTITYNDGDGNVAQSVVLQMQNAAGAAVTTATTNTTATNLIGDMYIYARTGVAIQYAIAYASSGATTMQYAAHLKVEAL